jgi:hypothetical protein
VSVAVGWGPLAGSAVAVNATTTTVTGCAPAAVAINQLTTCTVQVSDSNAGGSAPLGSVTFASSGAGGFSDDPCTLAPVGVTTTSSCTVTYTPTAVGTGTHTITASYTANDSIHADSSDSTGSGVTVTTRSTATTVTGCAPAAVAINQLTTCTVQVSDSNAGGSAPMGSVTFASSGTGGFSGDPCTLAQVGATTTSSCTVTYTPTAAGTGTHTITASYTATDSVHADSSDSTGSGLTVLQPSNTTLSVAPATAVTNQSVTLAATVTSNSSSALPSGTVTFYDGLTPIVGCADRTVAAQGATATCQTSFAASTSPEQLSAVFAPAAGSDVAGSSGATMLTIDRGASSTVLSVSRSTVNVAGNVTYAATPETAAGPVAPSGSAEFFDGNKPILSCTSQPLKGGTATCIQSYSSIGRHVITGVYLGDSNFVASSASPAQTVSVVAIGTISSTMQWTFHFTPSYTNILALVVHGAPVGGTVVVSCHGGGCPFVKRAIAVKRCKSTRRQKCLSQRFTTVHAAAGFQARRLAVGAQVNVRIIRRGWIGKNYLFTMRSRRQPAVAIGCLAPGGTRAGRGC